MCSHRTTHVDAKLNVLDEMDRLMKLLTPVKYDDGRPSVLTDEERDELTYERTIKHRPQSRKNPYD